MNTVAALTPQLGAHCGATGCSAHCLASDLDVSGVSWRY
jgi:hypothetical protein